MTNLSSQLKSPTAPQLRPVAWSFFKKISKIFSLKNFSPEKNWASLGDLCLADSKYEDLCSARLSFEKSCLRGSKNPELAEIFQFFIEKFRQVRPFCLPSNPFEPKPSKTTASFRVIFRKIFRKKLKIFQLKFFSGIFSSWNFLKIPGANFTLTKAFQTIFENFRKFLVQKWSDFWPKLVNFWLWLGSKVDAKWPKWLKITKKSASSHFWPKSGY